jgi:hypothetical protein
MIAANHAKGRAMPKKHDDIIRSRGIGLKLSEWEEVDRIAAELEMTPHAVTAYGIRYFLKAWHEGKIKPGMKKTPTLPDL